MPIKPRDFLDQAQRIIEHDEEVDYRTAISRAYYAALHCCQDLCRILPGGFSNSGSPTTHKAIIDHMTDYSRTPGAGAHRTVIGALVRQLRNGRKNRVKADYRLGATVTETAAKQHLAEMGQLKVQADHVRSQLEQSCAS